MDINVVKNIIPRPVKQTLKKLSVNIINFKNKTHNVYQHSHYNNIYHTCVPKTGSQWLKKIFSDPVIYSYSGLNFFTFAGPDTRFLHERIYEKEFKDKTIISPIYISYDKFQKIPKSQNYRTFFIMRDPRDIIISWYFSAKISHGKMGDIENLRKVLNEKNTKEGLIYLIDYVSEFGLFTALNSWMTLGIKDRNVMILKYEDLISVNSIDHFSRLFDFLGINLPQDILKSLLNRYSFNNLAGRKSGIEDIKSHYRKGVSGDWVNYFDAELEDKVKHLSEGFLINAGYK